MTEQSCEKMGKHPQTAQLTWLPDGLEGGSAAFFTACGYAGVLYTALHQTHRRAAEFRLRGRPVGVPLVKLSSRL